MRLTEGMSEKEVRWPQPQQWQERFFRYLEVERGCSDKTLRNYRHALSEFSITLGVTSWRSPVTDDFRRYLYELTVRRGLRASTVRLHFSALRSFYRFLVKQHLLGSSPLGDLSLPSPAKRLPRFFNEQQVTAFLEAPLIQMAEARNGKKRRGRKMRSWQYLRDAAVLEFLYSTGMRIHELVGMDHDDIDQRSLSVQVLGKGGKERIVILGEPAMEMYEQYRAALGCHPVPAFITGGEKRMTARSIQQRFKVYLEQAGLDIALTPHTLRHSFATHMLDHGADLRNVQELLGHANLSTTQIYTQLTAERMRKSYDQAHPAAR